MELVLIRIITQKHYINLHIFLNYSFELVLQKISA